jgi:predicted  nucleic acid-binding Zn-ribbon protein
MEKPIKIILFIVVALAVINLVTMLFSNGSIRDIRKDLEKAKLTADSALYELQYSKSKLDSIKSDMLVFSTYINRIQKTVELNDVEKRLKEEKDRSKIEDFKENIKILRSDIETDSLPDIDIAATR